MNISVTDYIVKYLEEYKIKHCFSVVGGAAMFLNDSFGRSKKIKIIHNHHEQACSIAAEGYSRSNNYKLSVVCVTSGPGGLNCLTGVMGQFIDSIPVLYISGQVKFQTTVSSCSNIKLRQLGDQEICITKIVEPITKYAKMVIDPYLIKYELEKAIYMATNERPGPVWLDIPLNIQNALIEEDKLVKYNYDFYIHKNDLSTDTIKKVIIELQAAKRPLIVAGHGIRISNAINELHNLIDVLKYPVVTTFNGFDLIQNDHSNFIGRIGTLGSRAGNFVLQNSDLILFLGTRNNIRQISHDWNNFAKNAKKIIVDIDNSELYKPTIKGDILIRCNVKQFIIDLFDEIMSKKLSSSIRYEENIDPNWLNWCLYRKRKYSLIENIHKEKKEDGINPYLFIEILTNKLKNDAIIVAGNGSACVSLFQAGIVKNLNQRFFWNSGCASMGYDIPASIGACIANNNKEIICITGDGSLQMNIQELQVIKHHKLPIKIFILNNKGYASIVQTQSNFFGIDNIVGCNEKSGISFPNYEKLANLYDMKYFRIESLLNTQLDIILKCEESFICEVILTSDYIFAPKLSSEKLSDGTLISQPLENMYPFLSKEELKSNMIKE